MSAQNGDEELFCIIDCREEGIKFDDDLVKTEEFQNRIKNVRDALVNLEKIKKY